MAEFRITNDHSPSQVAGIVDVLRRPRLWIPTERDYPDHDLWLQKVEHQLLGGAKRAMAAYVGSRAVGAVIYQRHELHPTVLEVRNISVSPEHGGRYFGSFLLRNGEREAIEHDFPGVESVVVDTKQSNTAMTDFLEAHGYELQEVTDLYGTGTGLDAIYAKSLAA